MSARDAILAAIRAAAVPPAPAMVPPPAPPVPDDLTGNFLGALEAVGGRGVIRGSGESLAAVITALAGDDRDELLVVPGRLAVAENGAVLVEAADLDRRADVVRAEHLVVVVPAGAIVATMHEAVRQIPVEAGCWWFVSGPSKTADIERALVIGAQGARRHTVVLDGG